MLLRTEGIWYVIKSEYNKKQKKKKKQKNKMKHVNKNITNIENN